VAGEGKARVAHFRLGDWIVKPRERVLQRGTDSVEIGARSMDVLVHLAEHAGEVVSAEQLLIECWRGTFYGDNPVHKAVTELRKQLGDQAATPLYIATIRKRGYRLLVPVTFPENFAGSNATTGEAWTDGSPFRGLEPFDARHAAVFFGRSVAIAQILQALRAQIDAGRAFVLCIGPSGGGKTSLIRAGVMPLLTRPGGFEGIFARAAAEVGLAGGSPGRALAHALMSWSVGDRPVFLPTEVEAVTREIATDPEAVVDRVRAALQWLSPERGGQGEQGMFVLVVDALEGLFANPLFGERERAAFVRMLDVFARSGHVAVIATCRNDFYPRVVGLPALIELKQGSGLYDLRPVTRGEIAQMIRRPAQAAALTFERNAETEEMLDDAICDAAGRNPEALPLLQYTLQELYVRRSDGGVLGFAAYHAIGGLEGALGMRAEAIFQQMDGEARASLPWLLQHMVALRSDDDSVTGRRVAWSRLPSEAHRRLVQGLVDARLLVSELLFGEPVVSVAHEALLRHWPRVVEWVNDNRAALQVRARLSAIALRWEREARRRDLLLPRGRLLDEARPLLDNPAVSLTDHEQAFVRTSDRHARLGQKLRVLAVSLIASLGVLAIVAAAVAIHARQDAERRRAGAEGLVDFMLGDLSERLKPLGRLDLLDSVSTEAMHYLADVPRAADRDASLHQAKALMQIGDIRLARADREQALTAFSQAMAVLQQLHRDHPGDADVLAELGKANYWLGQIHFREHDMAATGRAWEGYRQAAEERAVIEPANPDAWIELSYAYNNVGTVAAANGKTDEAIADFRRSIELKRKVLVQQPTNDTVTAELADSLSWVGSSLEHSGRLAEAADYYQQEFDTVSKARAADPTALVWRARESNAQVHIAHLAVVTGNIDKALPHYDEARKILIDIVQKQPDNGGWQRNLAHLLIEMGSLQNAMGQPIQARTLLGDATAIMKSLLAKEPSFAEWQIQLALCHRYLAMADAAEGHMDDAHDEAEQSVHILEGLKAPLDRDPVNRAMLAQSLLVEGGIERATGKSEASARSWQKALDLLSDIAPDSRDPRILDPWTQVLVALQRKDQAAPFIGRLEATGYRNPVDRSAVPTTP
jgi:DNA-binding winged helix-turn-helix (wHTH) protein/tetratricopeptide (TPR) repeat protein